MIKVNTILKNSFSNGAAFFVEALSAFIMMPFIVHRIGDSAYGIWLLINAITGYLGFFKLGLRPAINKHIAEFKALGDKHAIQSFVQTGFSIYSICAVLIFISTLVLYFTFDSFFEINPVYFDTVKIILIMAGFQTAFALMGTLFGGVISGYQRYDINAGIEIFVIILRSSIILIFLPHFNSLLTIAIAHFSLTTLGYIITIFFAKKIADLKFVGLFRKPSKDALKKIFNFSIISVGVSAVGILAVYTDNIIVGAILSSAAITHYSIGSRLIKYSNSMIQVISHVIAPATSELKAKNHENDIAILAEYTVKAFCMITFPVLLTLIIQGKTFIFLWMGTGYDQSYQIMLILAIAAFFILPQQVLNPILYGLAKHHYLLYVSILEVILSICLGYYFGQMYGLIGIAFGFSAHRLILRGILFPIFIYRKLNIKALRIALNCYFRIGIASIPFSIVLYLFNKFNFIHSFVTFGLQLLLCLSIYLIFCWAIGFSNIEREIIKNNFFKQFFSKKATSTAI